MGEWAIVDKLWPTVRDSLPKQHFIIGAPQTPRGILALVKPILDQLRVPPNQPNISNVTSMQEIIDRYLQEDVRIKEVDHLQAGLNTARVIRDTEEFFRQKAAARLDALKVAELQGFYSFDVTEKIRALILLHSRRSRYLY